MDGKAVPTKAGQLELEGEPGASFLVVVSDSGRHKDVRIVMSKDGEPSVSSIELATPVASSKPGESAKPEVKGKVPSAATATAAPTATPAPTAPVTGTKPPAKEDW